MNKNKPENGILITPRIDKLEDGTFEILIRRWVFVNSKAMSKEVLLSNGKWQIILEGENYPDNAFLSVTHRIVDRAKEAELAKEWEIQNIKERWQKAADEAQKRFEKGLEQDRRVQLE